MGELIKKTHGVLQRPDEVPEVLQVVLEHEEEEGGEGAEDDHELHGEGGEPLEAEPHGGHDLHEGLLEAKQLGELDGGGEHPEGELKWNLKKKNISWSGLVQVLLLPCIRRSC